VPRNATPWQTAEVSLDALERAAVIVGDRWSLLVVKVLIDGPQRFGELAEALGRIAPNILTNRLRHLEQFGLVRAMPYQQRPLRLSYELTEAGRELGDALALLASWGTRHGGRAEPIAHLRCGTPLETRLWCPTCDRVVDVEEADDLHHV